MEIRLNVFDQLNETTIDRVRFYRLTARISGHYFSHVKDFRHIDFSDWIWCWKFNRSGEVKADRGHIPERNTLASFLSRSPFDLLFFHHADDSHCLGSKT